MRRLLRALSGMGVFRRVGADDYAHTPVSRALRSSEGGSLLGAYATTECLLRAWDSLADAVRTGNSPFRALYGTDFYTYLSQHDPQKSAAFHAAMTDTTDLDNDDVVDALDLTGTTRLVDVGGGQGSLLRDILRRNEHLRGVLFDVPSALTDIVPELHSGALADRCELVGPWLWKRCFPGTARLPRWTRSWT